MPTLLQASISSVPEGCVIRFPSTVMVTSGMATVTQGVQTLDGAALPPLLLLTFRQEQLHLRMHIVSRYTRRLWAMRSLRSHSWPMQFIM